MDYGVLFIFTQGRRQLGPYSVAPSRPSCNCADSIQDSSNSLSASVFLLLVHLALVILSGDLVQGLFSQIYQCAAAAGQVN